MNKVGEISSFLCRKIGKPLFIGMLGISYGYADVPLKWDLAVPGLPKSVGEIKITFGVGSGQVATTPTENNEDTLAVQTNALAKLTLSETARFWIARIQEGHLPFVLNSTSLTDAAAPDYLKGKFTHAPVCLPLVTPHHPEAQIMTTGGQNPVSCGPPLSVVIAARGNNDPYVSIVDPTREKAYLAGFMMLAIESAIKELDTAVSMNSVVIPAMSSCAPDAQLFLNRQTKFAALPGLAELSRCIGKTDEEIKGDTFCSSTYNLRSMIFTLKAIYASTLRCRTKEIAVKRYFDRLNTADVYKRLRQEAKNCMQASQGDFPTIQEKTRQCLDSKLTPFFQNLGRAAFPELGL